MFLIELIEIKLLSIGVVVKNNLIGITKMRIGFEKMIKYFYKIINSTGNYDFRFRNQII